MTRDNLKLDSSSVQIIIIEPTKQNNRLKETISITDKDCIQSIIDETLNRNSKEMLKFFPRIKMTIKGLTGEKYYYIQNNALKYNGVSYQLESDFEDFVEKKLSCGEKK